MTIVRELAPLLEGFMKANSYTATTGEINDWLLEEWTIEVSESELSLALQSIGYRPAHADHPVWVPVSPELVDELGELRREVSRLRNVLQLGLAACDDAAGVLAKVQRADELSASETTEAALSMAEFIAEATKIGGRTDVTR